MRRWLAVVWSSAIAAAFLGPGTVTTAARAGSAHGLDLLWALAFSTFACLVLQEASARLTIVTGRGLGEALRRRARSGWGATALVALVLGAIVLGCAAYEAGNVLGGVAGARLLSDLDPRLLTLGSGALAAVLLGLGSTRAVVAALSALVAVMGVAFLATAGSLAPAAGELARGLAVPLVPAGGGLLVLGLVGTTVVPYNLFLGSGLARGQTLGEARFGLAIAVGLGGLISMAVLVVGTAVASPFGFEGLAAVLGERLGAWAVQLFALGLFAAGFTSAVTAPLAAAITVRSVFARGADDPAWSERGWRYRSVWMAVLAVGVGFGLSGVRPIPAIVLAQALNGVLLPLVAIFLWVAVNDRALMGERVMNGHLANVVTGAVVMVTVVLGCRGVLAAAVAALGWSGVSEAVLVSTSALLGLGLTVPIARELARARRGES